MQDEQKDAIALSVVGLGLFLSLAMAWAFPAIANGYGVMIIVAVALALLGLVVHVIRSAERQRAPMPFEQNRLTNELDEHDPARHQYSPTGVAEVVTAISPTLLSEPTAETSTSMAPESGNQDYPDDLAPPGMTTSRVHWVSLAGPMLMAATSIMGLALVSENSRLMESRQWAAVVIVTVGFAMINLSRPINAIRGRYAAFQKRVSGLKSSNIKWTLLGSALVLGGVGVYYPTQFRAVAHFLWVIGMNLYNAGSWIVRHLPSTPTTAMLALVVAALIRLGYQYLLWWWNPIRYDRKEVTKIEGLIGRREPTITMLELGNIQPSYLINWSFRVPFTQRRFTVKTPWVTLRTDTAAQKDAFTEIRYLREKDYRQIMSYIGQVRL